MKKTAIIIALTLGMSQFAMTQNEVDALRYSNLQFFGTARYMGMAGAFGAVGGDFSTLSSNPAGMGLYQSSEFVISPSLLSTGINSRYQGNMNEDFRYSLNFPNLGYVWSTDEVEGLWQNVQLGFGMNKLVSFNGSSYIEGINPHNSILNDFANQASNIYPKSLSSFGAGLAWDTYLLTDTFRANGVLEYGIAVPYGGVQQTRSAMSRGAINEMVISMSGNYNNQLFIGGSVGINILEYREESTYRESDFMDSIYDFKQLELFDELNTSASGVNFKLGLIYRPTDWVRLGFAVHSPTFFSLEDTYNRELKSQFDVAVNGVSAYTSESPEGFYEYRMETPMRLIGSIALIANKFGLLSADYEFVDYSTARLRSMDTKFSFQDANGAIKDKYTASSNIRLGAELRLLPLYLRGGYAIYGSPYVSGVNDGKRTYKTMGIGIRDQGYFIDFSYIRSTGKEDYYMYDPALVNPAQMEKTSGQFVMTLGITM